MKFLFAILAAVAFAALHTASAATLMQSSTALDEFANVADVKAVALNKDGAGIEGESFLEEEENEGVDFLQEEEEEGAEQGAQVHIFAKPSLHSALKCAMLLR